jgi:thiol-disulfide isomerase/thioredoxin
LIEKLADKEGPSLEGWVHEEMAYTFVAQDPLTDPMTSGRGKAALLLLERAGKSSYSRIRRIFSSLRLWVDGLRNKNNPKRLERLTAEDLETEETRSPRYRILLYDLMKSHPSIRPQALSYLDDIIKELQDEAATWPGGPPTSGSNGLYEKKARSKYWLAHAYYLKALNLLEAEDFFGAEKFFKLSSQFSPDATDAQFRYAYYYEKPFLSGKESYVQEYTRFLISRGKKLEALEALERLALFDHLMKKELAVLYNEMYDPATFKVYWLQLTARMLPQADDFAFLTLDNRTIKLSQLKGQWVLLDFWGVWCPPCVAELPQLEAFYKKTLMPQARNPKITLLTLDCRDRVEVVRSFMADQKYTFPVALGSDELVKYFRVIQYPTKVLITPSGQYVTISTPDWQDFIAGYVE